VPIVHHPRKRCNEEPANRRRRVWTPYVPVVGVLISLARLIIDLMRH
jgi:hypothetical protein